MEKAKKIRELLDYLVALVRIDASPDEIQDAKEEVERVLAEYEENEAK